MMLLASIQFGLSDVLADFLSMSSCVEHQLWSQLRQCFNSESTHLDSSIRVEIVYRDRTKLDAKDLAILTRPLIEQQVQSEVFRRRHVLQQIANKGEWGRLGRQSLIVPPSLNEVVGKARDPDDA